MNRTIFSIGLAATLLMTTPTFSQVSSNDRDTARTVATEVAALMADLEARAEGFPDVLEQLRQGQIAIEQADETVAQLIQQLTEATNAMQDGSAFDNSIDGFKETVTGLISESEASPNEAIRSASAGLRTSLIRLEADDESRRRTVVEARNVIAELEENRTAIAFFIRAGQVQQAAALIGESVAEYADIVARGQAVADSLIEAANP